MMFWAVSAGQPKTWQVYALNAEVIPDEALPALPSSCPGGSPVAGLSLEHWSPISQNKKLSLSPRPPWWQRGRGQF